MVYFKLYFNVPPGKSLMMEVDHYSIRSTQSSRIKSLFPLMPSVRDVLTLEPSSELIIINLPLPNTFNYRLKLSYSRNQTSGLISSACDLCNTSIQFSEKTANYPINVTIRGKEKEETSAEVQVQGNTSPACGF